MEKRLPGIIILIAGFVTMSFEIVGSRVLGPFFGSSVFVWTSLIGIIMGSLSTGYWLGGLFSLRRADFGVMVLVLSISAILMLITASANIYILERVVKYIPGIRLQTVVAVIILFGPASVGFGMVLPYGVNLRVQRLNTSGGTIGNLYALSTFGSIVGTFAAGFFMVPVFGYSNVLFAMPALLVLLALIVLSIHRRLLPGVVTSVAALLVVILWVRESRKSYDYIDADTVYNRVIIFETRDQHTGRPIKMLRVNDENSSAMFLDGDDDLVFKVLKYYRLVEHFVPGFRSAVMVGGSGYAFPKDYLKRYPQATLDVVEIDPGLTALARAHFNLVDDPALKIYHEDGRTFFNRNEKTYDAVLMDAYKSMITIPYQLTTKEAVTKIYDALSPGGAVLANVISSLDPGTNQFLQAELATYRSVFPKVMLFAVQYPNPTAEEKKHFQNFMLVGLKSDRDVVLTSENPELNAYLSHYYPLEPAPGTVILTDEYAPVEYYASKALR